MSKEKNSGIVRNLITIGVYNAIILIVFTGLAFTIGYFPPVLLMLPIILSLIGGPIFMLMLAKAPMNGVFTISGFLLGLTLITMAPSGSMTIACFFGGVLGDIMWSIMGSNKATSGIIGFCCNMVGLAVGQYFPLIYMKESYIRMYESRGTLEVLKIGMDFLSPSIMIIMIILTVIAAFIGGLWGTKLLKKHFKRAGIV